MDNANPAPLSARRSGPLKGTAQVPGDKSISHRSLIGATLATGHTVHATIDRQGRPVRMPDRVKDLFA